MSGIIALPILILLGLSVFLIPIIALLDIRKRDFPGAWRLYWVLIIICIPFLGSLIYGILGHRTFRS